MDQNDRFAGGEKELPEEREGTAPAGSTGYAGDEQLGRTEQLGEQGSTIGNVGGTSASIDETKDVVE